MSGSDTIKSKEVAQLDGNNNSISTQMGENLSETPKRQSLLLDQIVTLAKNYVRDNSDMESNPAQQMKGALEVIAILEFCKSVVISGIVDFE